MRLCVYPHDLGIGGSQLNAIDLAAAVRDLGHEVVVFGRPGPLEARIAERGLEFVAAPESHVRPGPTVVRALRRLVHDRGIDIVHGYEWPPIIDASCAVLGTPAVTVSTVMSMAVAPFIPRGLPLVVGTHAIAERERRSGRTRVHVIEPPVDLATDNPDLLSDTGPFRASVGADPDAVLVVMVGRLTHELKLEGLLTAIDTVPSLGERVQLVIVGDGPARDTVHAAAADANARHGRRAVLLPGAMEDPRLAYAAADIVLGMGGSALRALCFAKPLVVQGERGFWETLTPETVEPFLREGWYGLGDSPEHGAARLRTSLSALSDDERRRRELGAYGRALVEERFGLGTAAAIQVDVYERAISSPTGPTGVVETARCAVSYVGHGVGRKIRRRVQPGRTDDFNMQSRLMPTAATGSTLRQPDLFRK